MTMHKSMNSSACTTLCIVLLCNFVYSTDGVILNSVFAKGVPFSYQM